MRSKDFLLLEELNHGTQRIHEQFSHHNQPSLKVIITFDALYYELIPIVTLVFRTSCQYTHARGDNDGHSDLVNFDVARSTKDAKTLKENAASRIKSVVTRQ